MRLPRSTAAATATRSSTAAPRTGRWSAVVARWVKKEGGRSCEDVRVGLSNMGSTPLRATAVEEALRGGGADAAGHRGRGRAGRRGHRPAGDLNASADYKRHLARVLHARGRWRGGRRGVTARPPSTRRRTEALAGEGYLADGALATAVYLAATLEQPLLLEGEAGVGQDRGGARARRGHGRPADPPAVPRGHRRPPRASTTGTTPASSSRSARPRAAPTWASCSRAASSSGARCWRRSSTTGPVVLLIDEVDRADDEFEAFLLELLSDFAGDDPRARDDHRPSAGRSSSSRRTARASCTTRSSGAACTTGSTTRRPSARPRSSLARLPGVPEDDRLAGVRRRRDAARRGALQVARRGGDHRVGARAAGARRRGGSLEATLGAR